MHMLSRKDLNLAELETANERRSDSVRLRSRLVRDGTSPRGKRLQSCHKENPAMYTDIHMRGPVAKRIQCNTENFVPILVPGLSTGSFSSRASASSTFVSARHI